VGFELIISAGERPQTYALDRAVTGTGNLNIKKVKYVNRKVQLDATVCRHLFTAKTLYMFRVSQHPSSGALKTVTATSGIGHNTGTATSFQRGLIRTRWKEVAVPVL